ncbi:MAG: response regulator [Zetaproteobacteria bacterium]|nr:MAG: response regulator [Zetaproteobacteria bacterium]
MTDGGKRVGTSGRATLARRLPLRLALLFAPLLVGALIVLSLFQHRVVAQQEAARIKLAADTMVSSLKAIMLAGHGDIARDWMKRVAALPEFESAIIFRVDGTEAFRDQKTIDQVNAFIGERRFSRADDGVPPRHIDDPAFAAIAAGRRGALLRRDGDRITYLLPIHVEEPCLRCHGYTSHPIRGVLRLAVDSRASEVLEEGQERMAWLALFMVLLLAVGTWWLLRREVLTDLLALSDDVARVEVGDRGHRSAIRRDDEIGRLAMSFNRMLDSLHASELRLRATLDQQRALTEAVIALAGEQVSDALLTRVAELAMEMTGARYAMIAHQLDGERHFVPLGMEPEQLARLEGNPPQGRGLLGLLWRERRFVRVDDIAAHPLSAGFPEGHAPMRTLLGGPITFGDELLGVLYLTEKEGGAPFTEEDERLLRTLNSACGVALANSRTLAGLEQRVRERTEKLTRANEQLRQHELELELANDELRRANEFKDQFLANTSHELRTPLNAIIGFSELLANPRMGELNAKQKKFVQNIHNSGKGLLSVINNLLDLSKIESGMMDLHHESCRPAQLLEDVLEVMRPLADKKSIELRGSCAMEQEQSIFTDPGKLRQVLINLVGNAVKFTPDGGRIEVALRLLRHDGRLLLEGRVSDNGEGISEEDQERIFEPFVQAEAGLTRSHGGTGLGLSLTRKLVEMMGGGIAVESTLGEGSTFTFTVEVEAGDSEMIGAAIEEQAAGEAEAEAAPDATDGAPQQSGRQEPPLGKVKPVVLVVDGDHERAAAVAAILQHGGYDAVQTELAQVEEVATAYDPFLILLGVPDDPVELYRDLQQLRSAKCTRDLPVTLLGGTAAEPSFSFGTIDSVEKRLSDETLGEMLAHHSFQVARQANTSLVLVVDDEPSVREYMQEKLTSEGYRPLLAKDGPEGVEMARVHQPDMIILDLMMPGMSGFEVVEQLKRHPETADIPVMIFTAKDLKREEVMRLGQEVDKVLAKGSVGPKELLREMRSIELLYPAQAKLIDATVRMYNLRYLRLRLAQECNRAERYSHSFGLVGWEITNFRRLSEQYGYRSLNAALHTMSEQVRRALRGGDVAIRMGESRFAVLLTGIDEDGVERVREKLQYRLQSQRHPVVGTFAVVTAAVSHVSGMEPRELIDVLERRLNRKIA